VTLNGSKQRFEDDNDHDNGGAVRHLTALPFSYVVRQNVCT